MKVLVVTNPGMGHFLPMLPSIHALQRRGHDVLLATSRSFLPTVEQYGVKGIAAGIDWLETQASKVFPEIEEMTPAEQGAYFLEAVFADTAAHQMAHDLLALCADWQPDVIVRNDFEFASCVVAERLGIPQATISVSFFLSAKVLEPMIGEQLAYLRSAYDLNPYPALDMLYPYLYISSASPTLQPRELTVMHYAQPLPVAADAKNLPDWLEQLPQQPTVYASMSSVYRGADVFRTIIDGLRNEPVNLIITVGSQRDPASYGPLPPNIHIERFIPQAALFPRSDVFITHSPFFTVMSALSYGVPLLMIPTAGELIAGAMRVMELGLGKVLHLPDQPFGDRWIQAVSPTTIQSTVSELLHNERYQSQIQRTRNEIAQLPTPDQSVDLLEKLAREKAPIR